MCEIVSVKLDVDRAAGNMNALRAIDVLGDHFRQTLSAPTYTDYAEVVCALVFFDYLK